jgi:hypothetical protein
MLIKSYSSEEPHNGFSEIFFQALRTHRTACSTGIDLLKSDFMLLVSATVTMY